MWHAIKPRGGLSSFTHILDVARFLFGEAERVSCQTHRAHADVRGEDVARIVPCARNLLDGLLGRAPAETTAADNLETLRLVFAAYDAARTSSVRTPRGPAQAPTAPAVRPDAQRQSSTETVLP